VGSAATIADVRVCIVDDNRNFQNLFRTLLRGMGFRRVDVFADPYEAQSFVAQTPIDVAFVDLMMPGQNGIDWIRAARRSTGLANPTMPVTLVSGHVDRAVLTAAVDAGADDVLVKPLSPATLFRHTLRLLHRPIPYVRGPGGYFGPDLRRLKAHLRRDRGSPAPDAVAGQAEASARRHLRSLPGLNVEIRPRTGYDAEQTFLD
jgi:CheY-like chemotaxis protein